MKTTAKDINNLSTGTILWHVYKRHELVLLETLVAGLFTYILVTSVG